MLSEFYYYYFCVMNKTETLGFRSREEGGGEALCFSAYFFKK